MNRKVDQQQPLTTTRAVKLLPLSLTRQIPITTSQQAETHRTSIMINLIASMFLRIGGRACTILLSLYLKDTITSTAIVAVLSQIGYISELGLAPFAGNLSDRVGHKPLLILAPVLGFFSTLCILLGLLLVPSPPGDRINPATLILSGCIIGSRLLDGTMTAVHGPVSMSHFMIATTGQDRLRNRVMTLFEVFTLGGIAIALFGGGTASNLLGTQAYYIVLIIHVINILIITCLFRDVPIIRRPVKLQLPPFSTYLHILRDHRILTFLPSWIAINTLISAWLYLTMIILTYPHTLAVVRHPHQLLYGGFSPELAALFPSLFALSLLLGMFVWLPLLRLLRRTTIMAIALCGAILSIVALACMNSLGRTAMQPPGYSYNSLVIAILLTLFGVFLLSGFTPSAWVQIAMLLDLHKQQRGTAMSIFSVMLSAGQFLGLIMGGVAVDLNGFTGFMVFSMVLVVIATASVLYTRLNEIDLLSNS